MRWLVLGCLFVRVNMPVVRLHGCCSSVAVIIVERMSKQQAAEHVVSSGAAGWLLAAAANYNLCVHAVVVAGARV
jgi:hypothetical protein